MGYTTHQSVLTRKRDYTSLWAPSFFLRYIPLHVYQRFSWGQNNPVNERPLRLRRKGKMLWHLQQRADPSRPRAEKYTIDTSLTNTSVCFVFPCPNAALKPVQLQVVSPNGSSTCMGRLPRLKPAVFMLQVHAMHVTCRATACAQVPGCRRGQAERRSPECAVTALCARSSNELTKKSAGGTKPDPPGLQSQGCLSDGDRCGGVCCMFCVRTSRDFILPLIYVYIPQSCFIKGRNQNMGSSGTVGPRLVEVHIRPCAGDDGAHFDDDRKGKRDRRPQEGCWRAQSQVSEATLLRASQSRCLAHGQKLLWADTGSEWRHHREWNVYVAERACPGNQHS